MQEDGKFVLHPVEDSANLEARRFEVGLRSLSEDRKKMKEVCRLTDEDFVSITEPLK